MRGSAYRPPPLQIHPGLGQTPSFISPGFAGSLLFVAGGLGGFYVSDVFPSPVSGLLKGLGVIAAGWGAYSLISSFTGGAPPVGAKNKEEAPAAKFMSPAAFALVTGRIIDPVSGTLPQVTPGGWFSEPHFDIKIFLKNGSAEAGNFKYNILVYSIAEGARQGQPGYSQKIVGADQVTLAAGHDSGSIQIPIDVIKPEPPPISKFYGAPKTFKMYLQLQKVGDQADIPVGDLMEYGPFDYSKY